MLARTRTHAQMQLLVVETCATPPPQTHTLTHPPPPPPPAHTLVDHTVQCLGRAGQRRPRSHRREELLHTLCVAPAAARAVNVLLVRAHMCVCARALGRLSGLAGLRWAWRCDADGDGRGCYALLPG